MIGEDMNKLGKILKIILIIGTIVAIPIIVISPMLLNHTSKTIYSMFVIYPNGLLMVLFAYQFIKLFSSLENNNPFNFDNVNILKKGSIISLIMSILWFIDLLFMIFIIGNTYVNYIIVLIFLTGLFFGVFIALYILSELFRQATNYKQENDLTI
ncbi:MAG: DUF2975 domain-containing protein [Bacilli bacterium]|nr:DUF2975 domain-containing protein [Bacilli bacterium]